MLVFRKIGLALFSCYLRFDICLFALPPALCLKMSEALIFSYVFYFVIQKTPLSRQPGFKPSKSSFNQLIYITYSMLSVFDANLSLELQGVSLDSSEVFESI